MSSTLNRKPDTINMSDIARVAKVSRPTVSIVLNGRHSTARISNETRERVLQVARDLGYRRNALAHAVKTGRCYTLGFLTTAADSEYSTLIFSGILREAEERGYTVKRFQLSNTPKDAEVIERCSEERLDGVIVNDYGQGACLDAMFQEFQTQKIAHVWIASQISKKGTYIIPKDEQGIFDAVCHLADLGHQKIAFVGGWENRGTSVPRIAGFRRGLQSVGLDDSHICWTDWQGSVAEHYVETARLQGVTAFIAGSDGLALVIMLKLHRLGIHIPDEVSVIGCGNMRRVEYSYPPLTTVSVPYQEIGRSAVDKLLSVIQNPESIIANQEVALAAPLVVRESTGKCAVGFKHI